MKNLLRSYHSQVLISPFKKMVSRHRYTYSDVESEIRRKMYSRWTQVKWSLFSEIQTEARQRIITNYHEKFIKSQH